jgi:hypothetical protein
MSGGFFEGAQNFNVIGGQIQFTEVLQNLISLRMEYVNNHEPLIDKSMQSSSFRNSSTSSTHSETS